MEVGSTVTGFKEVKSAIDVAKSTKITKEVMDIARKEGRIANSAEDAANIIHKLDFLEQNGWSGRPSNVIPEMTNVSIRQNVLNNIANSQAARKASNFSSYVQAEKNGLMQRFSETLRSRKLGYNHEQGRFSYNETLGISRAEKALNKRFEPSDIIGVDIIDPNGLGNISLKGPFLNAQRQSLSQAQQQAVIKSLQKHISHNTAVDVHIIDTLGLSDDVIKGLQEGLTNSPVKVIYIK